LAYADVPSVKIMISSTRADLQEYRNEASKVIQQIAREHADSVHLIDKSMEWEIQRGDRQWPLDVSKRWVEESDWIIVIVGFYYGSVSDQPEAEGRSMTEWEYRRADAPGTKKKVFVFLADDPDETTQHREHTTEPHGLKHWLVKTDQDNILRFRKDLQETRYLQTFAGLDMFREQLISTLRRHIVDVLFTAPTEALAGLIAAVSDAFKAFTDEVQLIVDCKAIHDHLYELLRNVVRPLQERVFPKWKEAADLKDGLLTELILHLMTLSEETGALKGVLEGPTVKSNGGESDLGHAGNYVLACARQLRPEKGSGWDREKFDDHFYNFAIAVNDAFHEADRRMQDEMRILHQRREELFRRVADARGQRPLSAPEDRRLDSWLREVDSMLDELATALATHHVWQEIHEAIESVDAFRETEHLFRRSLTGFCANELAKLIRMASKELETLATLQGTRAAAPAACGDPRIELQNPA
jgi:uncharacterized protein DUF4062